MGDPLLAILHLCDSLFPLGSFAYSDGLEAAIVQVQADVTSSCAGTPDRHGSVEFLREWMAVALNETLGRADGPVVWSAWRAFREERWDEIVGIDAEITALRPSATARRANRAMGRRLLTTWSTLHPDPRLAQILEYARAGRIGPALAVAFAGACACAGMEQRQAVQAFAYTRLAATTAAAMRLLPIGQTDAHRLLARALDSAAAVIDRLAERQAPPESFAPALDIACMSQQYLHSRLFRS